MTYVPAAASGRSMILRADRRAAAALAGLALAPILADNGGYFPVSWGWTAVGFGWAAALAVVIAGAQPLSAPQWLFVAGLTAFAVWTAASSAWSIAPTQTVLEAERTLAFVAAAIALVVTVRPRDVDALLAAVTVGSTAICLYSLATRLFPDRVGSFDPIAGYRLSTPVGYWNSLGLVAAMAALLASSGVGSAATRLGRSAAAGALPVLIATLYFTFSRGAWVALATGAVALIAYAPGRLALIGRVLPAAAVSAVAVALASRERALTHLSATVETAAHEGHRLALVLVALAIASALFAVLADAALRHLTGPEWLRHAATAALVLLVGVGVLAGLIRIGSPSSIPRRVYHSFVATPTPSTGNLNSRLFSLSGNGRWPQWKVGLHAFDDRPIAGIGAGGYERYWLQHRTIPSKIRDVHSLYIETLAELGVFGLGLLLVVLAAPFFALRRARGTPLASGALAAFVAYLVHAAVDWDWELSGVTLVALVCGGALLIAGRGDGARPAPRVVLLTGAVVVAILGFVGLAGNIALSQSASAARGGNWESAASHARRAHTFAPWSSQPWQDLGEAQLGAGDTQAAVASFNKALGKSPGDWSVWFDMARATTGAAQRAALDHAARLNPLSPEIAELRREIAAEKVIQVGQK